MTGVHFIRGDFLHVDLGPGFDVIVACSVIDRVGGNGRDPDRDLKAMRGVAGNLNRNGLFFLTVPVGRDSVIGPSRRVYGRERLPKLLAGFELVDFQFMVKHQSGRWAAASPDAALEFPGDEQGYALGQMVLRNEWDVGIPQS